MEEVLKCRLLQDFRSPKKIMGGTNLTFKLFKQGDVIEGSVFNQAGTPLNYAPVIKTSEGYIIPESYLTIIAAVPKDEDIKYQEAEVVEDKDFLSSETKDKAKKVVEKINGNTLINTKTSSKQLVNGVMIGAGIGLLYALTRGGNKIVLSGIGALLGGVAVKTYYKNKH